MTAGEPFPQQAKPYTWDETRPPQETLRLWTEVGNGIDKSQTGKSSGALLHPRWEVISPRIKHLESTDNFSLACPTVARGAARGSVRIQDNWPFSFSFLVGLQEGDGVVLEINYFVIVANYSYYLFPTLQLSGRVP